MIEAICGYLEKYRVRRIFARLSFKQGIVVVSILLPDLATCISALPREKPLESFIAHVHAIKEQWVLDNRQETIFKRKWIPRIITGYGINRREREFLNLSAGGELRYVDN